MIKRIVSVDGTSAQLMRARNALNSLSGVVAAEIVPGRNAVRVWQGDELSESALLGALSGNGIPGGHVSDG